MRTVLPIIGILAAAFFQPLESFAAEKKLFDGETLAGWEGNTNLWRVENGAIVAGWINRLQPRNDFLVTTQEFHNFHLRLQFKLEGTNGFVNGGVQFWSQRITNSFEMIGYQADIGEDYYGGLYDEMRRKKVLQMPSKRLQKKLVTAGDWNEYQIRAQGGHIEEWLNGGKTADYAETEQNIPTRGKLGLQIHGGAYTKVQYRKILIEELP